MDLACRGRPDMADGFLAAYAEASGDFDSYSVADFYMAYRAGVRGKIACLAAEDMGIPAAARSASRLEGERHFRFALSQLRRHSGGAPLIAAGGGVASGKSTLAAALGERLAAPVLSSDLIRKRLAGIDPLERRREKAWDGLYAPAITEKVYAEMAGWAGLI